MKTLQFSHKQSYVLLEQLLIDLRYFVSQNLVTVPLLYLLVEPNLLNYLIFCHTGVAKERPSPRHLLPSLEVSRSTVTPRAETGRALLLRLPPTARGGLRQPVSLLQSGPANSAASSCSYALQKQRSKIFYLRGPAGVGF